MRIFNFLGMPSNIRHILFISLLMSVLFAKGIYADNTYPLMLERDSYIEGGRYIVSEIDSLNFVSYFIKPGWNNKTETIYSWNGSNREDTKAITLNNKNVISAFGYSGKLLTIEKESDRIFLVIYDSLLKNLSISELFIENYETSSFEVKWLQVSDSNALFTINRDLFLSNLSKHIVKADFIAGDVTTGLVHKDKSIYYIKMFSSNCELYKNSNGSEVFLSRLPLLHHGTISIFSDYIYLVLGNIGESQSLILRISPSGEILYNNWIDSSPELITVCHSNEFPIFVYPILSNGKIHLISSEFRENRMKVFSEIFVPDGFSSVLKTNYRYGLIYTLFNNGLIISDFKDNIKGADLFPVRSNIGDSPYVKVIGNRLIILSDNASIILTKKGNYFWLFYRFFQTSGRFLLPGILLFVIIILIQLYRHQKRLFNELLAHPFAGIIIFIDKSGKIKRINELGRKFFGISNNIPLNKPYGFYFLKDETKPFRELFNESYTQKSAINKRLSIISGNAVKEWYCSITPIRNITGNFRGLIFAGIDITEQLERKRLSNWAQLAHDMQTSLSTIRLNAELLETDLNSENIRRRVRIIHQVNLLIQRVRDIVTVGRSDKADLREISSEELCREVRSEFDPQLFPDVEFELELNNFLLKADKAKLARALRNAIENGIKSLQNKTGLVEIKCWKDGRSACFSIKDHGKGMDDETKQNMLKPYFTTSKDGKGFGIGTMIMQQAVEQHNGKMIINSEKNIGTEIIFKIPLSNENRLGAGRGYSSL